MKQILMPEDEFIQVIKNRTRDGWVDGRKSLMEEIWPLVFNNERFPNWKSMDVTIPILLKTINARLNPTPNEGDEG